MKILGISFVVLLLLSSSLVATGAFASEGQSEKDTHQDDINGPGGLMSLSGTTIPTTNSNNPLQIKEHHPAHVKKFIGTFVSLSGGGAPVTIWSAYGFNKLSCTHTTTTDWTDPNLCGHGQTIAIVDAYDDPNIASDLQTFNTQFGLPVCTVANGCFVKSVQGTPPTDSGWALETSLDVEWAHSIAPGAKIVLVESSDNTLGSLLIAEDVAVAAGAQQVSNSWGSGEFPQETQSGYDSHFNSPTASFFASSGDYGHGVMYPASSPYVIAVGGTTLVTNTGNWANETAWAGSGGGISAYETKPSYQNNFNTYTNRAVPDVSYDGNPNTGVYVYDSVTINSNSGWWQVGGTSAGAPQWAGISAIINSQNAKLASTSFGTSNALYGAATGAQSNPQTNPYVKNYHDITTGNNGACGSLCNAVTGYDYVTGLGSPQVNNLVSYFSPPPPRDFIITASPTSLTIHSGSSSSSTITVTSVNGFTGTVSLSSSPSSSSTISPISVIVPASGSTTATLSLRPTASTTYTITGTSGSLIHPTTVTVTMDTITPTLTITSPANNTVTSTTALPVSGTSSDNISIQSIKWKVDSGTVSTASGTTSWSFTTSSLSNGAHIIHVNATDAAGNVTPKSITVTVPTIPSAPQNLVATAGNTQVTLKWNAPSSNGGSTITGYNIYRGTTASGESATAITSLSGSTTSYTDTGLTNGNIYYYKIKAVNSVGTSLTSNEASATPQTPKLSISVTTDKSTYSHGSTAYITVTVTNLPPISGASLALTVTNPTGSIALHSNGATNSNGQLTFSYNIGGQDLSGTYTANDIAFKSGYIYGIGSIKFSVS